ncbi:MAG: hypothetical protein A2Y40_10490 [Candidatus Margulisbacteria bacterium GWF2_35_9]|nr:MAG: hypothetical protein A2Y40_10490 [Candidatus Margulisbacteria bacterium GWF2_35_9]
MTLVDTHIHLTDEKYKAIPIPNELDCIISLGTDLKDSVLAMELAETNPRIFFGAGVHPHEADKYTKSQLNDFCRLYDHNKCAVVGEIGLDYHYLYSSKEKQLEVFLVFLGLAQQHQLPVSVHSRKAEREVFNILSDYPGLNVVCHSYTGDIETLEDLIALGCFFSINGMITFKNNTNIVEIVKKIPTNKLLFETDGPYLAPIPYRGQLNRPEYVKIIAEKTAEILNTSLEEISKITTENAHEVFFCDLQGNML